MRNKISGEFIDIMEKLLLLLDYVEILSCIIGYFVMIIMSYITFKSLLIFLKTYESCCNMSSKLSWFFPNFQYMLRLCKLDNSIFCLN